MMPSKGKRKKIKEMIILVFIMNFCYTGVGPEHLNIINEGQKNIGHVLQINLKTVQKWKGIIP